MLGTSGFRQLSVSVTGEGDGRMSSGPIDCPSRCSANLTATIAVILTAQPDQLNTFVGWSGIAPVRAPATE